MQIVAPETQIYRLFLSRTARKHCAINCDDIRREFLFFYSIYLHLFISAEIIERLFGTNDSTGSIKKNFER